MIKNFFDFKETGSLKLDKIFFESYYPILFTCITEKNDLFLCVCCQADLNIRKWLVTNVSPSTIIELLSNKLTIRESFLKDRGAKYSIIYSMEDRNYQIEQDNAEDWDEVESINLPTVGEYMDAEGDEFLEEIRYFEDMENGNIVQQEVIKIGKEEFCKEDFNINVYRNGSYNTKYTIGSMEELNNNHYYEVLWNINKEKIFFDSIDKIFEENLNSFIDSKISVDNILINLDTNEDLCIKNSESNFIDAA